jgi:DNA-binding response OmpR family regulator
MKTKAINLAVLEDDSVLREELCAYLSDNGFVTHEAMLGLALDALLLEHRIDLILLDLNLPGENGFDIARRLKRNQPHIGILMLTARTSLSDRIKSYESGVDIYLPKPTPAAEILAALNSIYRRISRADLERSSWILDTANRQLCLTPQNIIVHLTMTEVQILIVLIRSKEHKIDADSFCVELTKNSHRQAFSKRALENSISRLRKKVTDLLPGEATHFIDSIWGFGYQLCIPVSLKTP